MEGFKKIWEKIPQKRFFIGMVLIVVAVICLLLNLNTLYKQFGKKETHKANTYEKSKDNGEKNNYQVTATSSSISTEKMETETTVDSDYIINSNFVINDLPEEINTFIDNSNKELLEEIQKELYYQGFYSYQSADFGGECDLDYKKNTVTLSFTVTANKIVKLDAVYNRTDKSWLIKVW